MTADGDPDGSVSVRSRVDGPFRATGIEFEFGGIV